MVDAVKAELVPAWIPMDVAPRASVSGLELFKLHRVPLGAEPFDIKRWIGERSKQKLSWSVKLSSYGNILPPRLDNEKSAGLAALNRWICFSTNCSCHLVQ